MTPQKAGTICPPIHAASNVRVHMDEKVLVGFAVGLDCPVRVSLSPPAYPPNQRCESGSQEREAPDPGGVDGRERSASNGEGRGRNLLALRR